MWVPRVRVRVCCGHVLSVVGRVGASNFSCEQQRIAKAAVCGDVEGLLTTIRGRAKHLLVRVLSVPPLLRLVACGP